MGRKRAGMFAAVPLSAALLVTALTGCSATPSRQDGPAVSGSSASSGSAAAGSTARAEAAEVLAAKMTSAVTSAATKAAAAAATAARAAAKSSAARSAAPPAARSAPSSSPVRRTTAKARPAPVVTGDAALESEVFSMINQERADNGLPALQLSGALTTAARQHSAAMAAHGLPLSHQFPGEASVQQREAAAGYRGSTWAENIGMIYGSDAGSAASLQDDLYNEQAPHDGHRLNILSTSMRAVGVGIVIDRQGQLWLTEDFGG